MDKRIAAGVAPAPGAAGNDPSITLERHYAARNYDPLPVVLAKGEGSWLWDEHGRRYLDMMSAYSAVSCGHAHPRIVATLVGPGAEAGGDVARVPQPGPAEAVRAPRAPHRPQSRDSVEWGCRSRRNGAEGGAQVGLPGQGHSCRHGRGHRLQQQFPRALDHDRRLFVGAAIPRRLRTIRAGLQGRFPLATPAHSRARSGPTPRRSSSSRSRARAASSCRRKAISRSARGSAASATCF